MINVIILSKDRACQLDLLFQSIRRFCPSLFSEITVIYKASNSEYEIGYEKLFWKVKNSLPFYDKVVWYKEKEFYKDFIQAIDNCNTSYICGLTDDCLFYDKINVSANDIKQTFTDDVFCFSFRLGVNTIIQNYMTGEEQYPLLQREVTELNKGEIIKWNWKLRPPMENYAYPVSLDGHIFRTKELLKISTIKNFTCLRQWEGELSLIIRRLTAKPYMASLSHSVLFNIPANCVQDPPLISGTQFPYSVEELNQKYLDGQILDLDFILNNCMPVLSSHKEVEFRFRK